MLRNLALLILLTVFTYVCKGQHIADSFQNAQKNGVTIWKLDSIYKSACHADTSLSVFKTDFEIKAMFDEFEKLIADLKIYLKENNFKFGKPTKSINRVYFSEDGSIDYFYFNFVASKPENRMPQEKQDEFRRLLSAFIQNYKIGITAPCKFAQYSPSTFTD